MWLQTRYKVFLVINKYLGFERLAYLFDLISEFLFLLGYHLWAEDGSCHQDGEVGPCDDNQAFSFDPESGTKLQ